MNLFEEYQWRGMVYDATEKVADALANEKLTAYIGFDPTAASLHVGSMLPVMALARLQRFGHSPIALVGGGTGLVGDPSGKTQERQLLSKEKIEENLQGIRNQLLPFLDFEAKGNPAKMVNNADWLTTISFTDFLRDVGKYFTVNHMLAKESVRRRLEESGLSFTEFSYILLQSYDYLVLHDRYGCRLQMGGSDQWGNIVGGIDLIERLRADESWQPSREGEKRPPLAHGIVFPLVTTAAGTKFGKTEAGTIWLDANMTSPFKFYQFWLNTDDRDVDKYLKFFTWLGREEIEELARSREAAPEKRESQVRLAREVTRNLHGETALAAAERASAVLFGGEIEGLGPAEVEEIFSEVPSSEIPRDLLAGDGLPIADLLVQSGLVPSKAEARRSIQAGGIYLNNQRVADEKLMVTLESAIGGRFLVLRKGRKTYHLIRIGG